MVRQYRFLLREASPDAVEAAHAEALPRLPADQRQAVLGAVQLGLVAGQRLTPDDTTQLAHLIVLGERRTPNAFLSTCNPATLRVLSEAVVHSDACFGLFGPYAGWDGADPEPEPEGDGPTPATTPTAAGGAPRENRGRTGAGSSVVPAVVTEEAGAGAADPESPVVVQATRHLPEVVPR